MRTPGLVLTSFVLFGTFASVGLAEELQRTHSTYRVISALDLRNAMTMRERPLTVVDVGGVQRWSEAHIPGSTPLDPKAAKFPVSPLDSVVVYHSGFGSGPARQLAQRLVAEGYKDVAVLPGGLAEWEAAAYPVDREAPAQVPTPVNPSDVQSAITQKDEFVLLDVRSADRFAEQRILGAVQASPIAPAKSLAAANKADWIVVYDGNDGLAEIAVRELRAQGYERAAALAGGLSAFIGIGGLTERGPPPTASHTSERQDATPPGKTQATQKRAATRPTKKEQSKSGREGTR